MSVLVATVINVTLGSLLVIFPKSIAAWYCARLKEFWRLHEGDSCARALEGAVWVIERISFGSVYDEASAPKAVRFLGFALLAIALIDALTLL